MGRIQLFEFEDQAWFPRVVRDAMTDFLAFVSNLSPAPLRPFATRLGDAMKATGDDTIVDLCSGGGGPVPSLLRVLREQGRPARAVLTDLFPNRRRFEALAAQDEGIEFVAEPVDATRVPAELKGFRLVANGFHHLPPDTARAVLADAVAARRGIAVIELVNRSAPSLLSTALSPLTLLVVTPFIRPRRLSRFVFTYLVPVVPLASLWDGVVSCLRVYEPDELRALVASLPANDYVWDIGEERVGPGTVTYLVGHPRA